MAQSFLNIVNRLLPFATPGTPLIQDLLHLAGLCILLYFAPQIQEWLQSGRYKDVIRQDEVAGTDVAVVDENIQRDAEARDAETAGEALGLEEHLVQGGAEVVDDVQPPAEPVAEDEQPAPVRAVNLPPERNVGAKKAKSLAKRDQRRAYHEFMRSQGEAQRAKDAEGAMEREAALAAERERRRAAEAALESKKAREREVKRAREEAERREELRRRNLALTLVKDGLEVRKMCDLSMVARQVGDDVDENWVEQMLRASGMLGKKDGFVTMVTGTGWVVRVTADDMAKLYAAAAEHNMGDNDGRIEYEELGAVLETMLCA